MKPQGQTLEEMLADFKERANVDSVTEGLEIEQDSEKGFMTYIIKEGEMFIPEVYGDGQYWLNRALEIARAQGATKLVGITRRNPKAYCKFFGLRIAGYLVEREVE